MKQVMGLSLVLLCWLSFSGCGNVTRKPLDPSAVSMYLAGRPQEILLDCRYVLKAEMKRDPYAMSGYSLLIMLNEEGEALFRRITAENIGEMLTIAAYGKEILTAKIIEEIPGGAVQVTGLSREEIESLVEKLNGN